MKGVGVVDMKAQFLSDKPRVCASRRSRPLPATSTIAGSEAEAAATCTLTPTSHLRRWLVYFCRVNGLLTSWLAPPISARSLLVMLPALKGNGSEHAVGVRSERAWRDAQCCKHMAAHRIAIATTQRDATERTQ
jgi:hypothetical protein